MVYRTKVGDRSFSLSSVLALFFFFYSVPFPSALTLITFSPSFPLFFNRFLSHALTFANDFCLAYFHANNVKHHVVYFQGRHKIPFNSHFLSDSRHWINHVCHALFMTTDEIPNHFSSTVSITPRPCPLFITNVQSCDWLICHSLTAVRVPIDLISNQLACYYWK